MDMSINSNIGSLVPANGRAALLVMDVQNDVVALMGDRGPALVERTAALIAQARAAQIPVVYVVVAFRPGYPELDPDGPMYARLGATNRLIEGASGTAISPAVAPQDGEVVVTKRRVSAFAGTDLETILRARRIDTLILAGIATSGVVLSTVRQATDMDYKVAVVKDCCGDADDEVHRVLTEKVFARAAKVVALSELM
jgi:nicotinamidase-related amidase